MDAVEKDIDIPPRRSEAGEEPSPTNSSTRGSPVVGPPSIWRRVRRDLVLLAAGNIGIVVAQLGFRSIVVAALVPESYGRLSLVLSVYNTVWIIGASGLPSAVARYIALIAPADDSAIIRSAVRAAAAPTFIAASLVATVAAILLKSPLAFLVGAVGLSSLVYSLLTMGILRGRGRIGAAASVLPIAGIGELALITVLWRSGLITPMSAFAVFCLGNLLGLVVGWLFVMRTAPDRASTAIQPTTGHILRAVPTSRKLLGFSLWLSAATVGITVIPLVLRFAAALDSYTTVAIIDISLVLFTIPQRMG